jgi:hypothetical protein
VTAVRRMMSLYLTYRLTSGKAYWSFGLIPCRVSAVPTSLPLIVLLNFWRTSREHAGVSRSGHQGLIVRAPTVHSSFTAMLSVRE